MKRLLLIAHRSLLIVLLLVVCAAARAEFSGLPDGVKANLPAIKKYPKASSILLWVRDSYTQNEDRSQIYEHHEFRYLADEAARDTWGDPRMAYDDKRQKIDVVTARAYTTDGRTVDITPNALNPVTPDELDHAPDFAHHRQLVVTLLGLENGSIAELHYRVTTDRPLYPWLWGRVYFRDESPTISRELAVTLPAGKPLNYRSANGAPEPVVSGLTYTWKFGEQPGYLADDLRGHRVLLPNVAFTTATDWKEVTAEFAKRVNAALERPDFPPSLRQKLIAGLEPENRLDSIKTWIRERFNEIEFAHPDFNVAVRPAGRVLETGYGSSLELAVLAASLSATAGLKTQPAAWFAFEPPVPYLYDLTGGLVSVPTESGQMLCSPIASREDFPAAELADATVLLTRGEGSFQSPPPASGKSSEIRINLNIDALNADTLHGSGTLFASGLCTPYEAFRSDPKAHLEHLISWSGFAVKDVSVRQLQPENCAVSFAFSLPGLDSAESHRLLAASAVNLSQFAGSPDFGLERRDFSHWVKLPGDVSVHWEAPIPASWTVSQPLPAITRAWKNGGGTRTAQVKEQRLTVDERLTLGGQWILPQDWPEFRSFLIETGPRPSNVVVFTKNINQ